MIVAEILSWTIWEEYPWIRDGLSLMGSLASLFGVILALVQIDQANIQIRNTKSVLEETRIAVDRNRDEIRQFLSFSNLGHLIETIKHAQENIRTEEYSSAVIMLQDIKDNLRRVDKEVVQATDNPDFEISKIIKEIGVDISSLTSHIVRIRKSSNYISTIEPTVIHEHLETARDIIISLESAIKNIKL